MNAIHAFASEYRTRTRDFHQEIEDLKLSNKMQVEVLQEVGSKVDKYASARSHGRATDDLSEENVDRTEQYTKERRELSSAKPTRSTTGDRCTSELDPDLLQRPDRQPPGKRRSQRRLQRASRGRRGSRLRHDENNHHMERSMSEEQDNRSNMPLGRTRSTAARSNKTAGSVRVDQKILKAEHLIPWNWKERKSNLVLIATVPTQMMMSPFAHLLETSLKSSYQEKCSFPRTPQEEWMTKLRSFGRNSSTKTREEHETPNENLSHQARSDQCICEN